MDSTVKTDPVTIRVYKRKSYAANLEESRKKGREAAKRYRDKNPDKWREVCKRSREKNKQHRKELSKLARVKHKVRITAYMSEYRKRPEYAEQKRIRERKYRRNRMKSDPEFRIMCALRIRMVKALRGTNKSDRTKALLGCTIEHFRAHLESQFKRGMTWKNYGKWHIDHRIPCEKFDMSDSAQQRQCFHFTNMQPLWGPENVRKGDRLLKHEQMGLLLTHT